MTRPSDLDTARTVDALRTRARKAVARFERAERELTDARQDRDELIKEFRATGLSIPKIADAVGVSESTVKVVLR